MNTTTDAIEVLFEEVGTAAEELETPDLALTNADEDNDVSIEAAKVTAVAKVPKKLPKTIQVGHKYRIVNVHKAIVDNTADRKEFKDKIFCTMFLTGVINSTINETVKVIGGRKETKAFNMTASDVVFAKPGRYKLKATTMIAGKSDTDQISFTVIS